MKIIDTIDHIQQWVAGIIDESDAPVALTMKQNLESVEGNDVPVFPPSFAREKKENSRRSSDYDINIMSDGKKQVCLDTVGSQANRIETLFKDSQYEGIVPQYEVRFNNERVSVFDIPHRVSDAVIKSTTDLGPRINKAIQDFKANGNCRQLIDIAPTSLVFGFWDSRDTGQKTPRLVRSFIRANDIEEVTASAQYFSVLGKLNDDSLRKEVKQASKDQNKMADAGLDDVPSYQSLGGVLVNGDIVRTVSVNLNALRTLAGSNSNETKQIQMYVLALSLISATHDIDLNLRQGCHLKIVDKKDPWVEIPRRGTNLPIEFGDDFQESIFEFAKEASKPFKDTMATYDDSDEFNVAAAKKLLKNKSKGEESE